ncbi:receptor-like protein EIX2 [Camellia sinensis]|uniref:receptor-like protein EIX2 n=1 Tax=Camellia sinensis TaxID=4442 RepID=UPI0010367D54|nr:receptor-like protein EIX2 [Camellia sinensis]
MDRFMRVIAFLVLVILTIATINLSSCNGDVVCINSEKQALLCFKREFKDPSNKLSSWDVEDDCCKWAGVVCDKLNGHVIELYLQNPNSTTPVVGKVHQSSVLDGKIDPSLVNLTCLNYLDLSQNDFGGIHIPRFIESLANLHYLSYPGQDLEERSPTSSEPVNLNDLLSLNLHQNGFEGPLPGSLWNMTNLRDLDLSKNNFNSIIPFSLYSCSHLESLNLGHNQFQGAISSNVGNLTSVTILDLSYNKLEGRIPMSMGNLCNLRVINLSSNKLVVQVLDVLKSLSGCILESLETLGLWENKLFGHFTERLGQFKNLRELYFQNNLISGPIPMSLGKLSSIVVLDLSYNKLNGTLPKSLGHLSKLGILYISYNMLEGVVSENHFANLTSLVELLASVNQLSFDASPNWIPPFQLELVYLRSWQLGPQFPIFGYSHRSIF